MTTSCILLNGDYTFLCLVSWKRAMKLVMTDKVKVLKYSKKVVKSVNASYKTPAVMVLIKMVRSIYKGRVPFSKKNILIRDRYSCAYCGRMDNTLTLDHIIPVSRGGKTDFDNCVSCCSSCNSKKGAMTPKEAGMHLKKQPYQPTISEFIKIRLKQSGIYNILSEIGIFLSN